MGKLGEILGKIIVIGLVIFFGWKILTDLATMS